MPLTDAAVQGDGGTRTTSPLRAKPPVVSCSTSKGTSPFGVATIHSNTEDGSRKLDQAWQQEQGAKDKSDNGHER